MKQILLKARDVVEIYLPVAAFLVMFTTFILQVFFRYAIRQPLTWTQEIIVIGFVWTVIFGACYTMRTGSHVKFTLIYDRLSPKKAAVTRLLGNLIILITFAVLVRPSYSYSFFVGFQKTAVFRISFTPIFIPFVYFLLSIIGYTLAEIIEDVKVIAGKLIDSKDHTVPEVLR